MGKSNEIKIIPELLEILVIKGALASVDAMGPKHAIAATIATKEADSVPALTANSPLSTSA